MWINLKLIFLIVSFLHCSSGSFLEEETKEQYSQFLSALLRLTGKKCLIVNLLPKNDLGLLSVVHLAMTKYSDGFPALFNIDIDDSANQIEKLGDLMRKMSRCNVVLGQLGENDSAAKQLATFQKIHSVGKKIRSGFICLMNSKLNSSLDLSSYSGKKIVTRGIGSLVVVDLVCPYGQGQKPAKTFIYGSRFFKSDLNFHLQAFEECVHPLKGKSLKVGSLGETPYVFSDHNRNIQIGPNGQPFGINNGIISTLSKVLDFTYSTAVTGRMNFFDRNLGAWQGIAGDLIAGKLDIGITAQGYVPELFNWVDYTGYTYIYLITITCCQPRRLAGLYNVIRPFGIELWLAVIGVTIMVGITFGVIYRIFNKVGHKMVLRSSNKKFYESLIDSTESLIQYADVNGFKKMATFSSANLMILSWSLVGMLFVFAYTCNLRSSLIYKPTTKPPNTMQEVLDTGLKLYMPDKSTLMQELANSNKGVYRELYLQVFKTKGNYPYDSGAPRQIWEEVGDCLANMIHMKIATYYTTFPGYTDAYGRRIYNKSRIIQEDFSPSYAGLLLPKYSSYTKDVNDIISRIHSGGLQEHYTKSSLPLEFTMDPQIFIFNDDSNEKISMENLFLIFTIWGIGMLIGFAIYLCENMKANKTIFSQI